MNSATVEHQPDLAVLIAQVRRRAEGIARAIHPECIEVADIENDLWLALLQFDPCFPLNLDPANVKRAIRRACKSTNRKVRAELRCRQAQEGLQALRHADSIGHETVELAHDVGVVMARLPWRMFRLALHLMDSSGPEAAERWGISNAAVYGTIRRMRRHFRAAV